MINSEKPWFAFGYHNGQGVLKGRFITKILLCLVIIGLLAAYVKYNIHNTRFVHQLTSSNTEASPSWNSYIWEKVENVYQYSMTYVYNPSCDCEHCLRVDYEEIIQPKSVCLGSNPEILLLIATEINQKDLRDILRRTWLQPFRNNTGPVRYVFLLGKSQLDSIEQGRLTIEGSKYQDILQSNYIDRLRNLTIKTVTGLRWVTRNCRNIKYIIKLDSDVWLNMPKWRKLISGSQRSKLQNVSFGHCVRQPAVIRTIFHKYAVSWNAYPQLRHPSHCLGAAYALPFKLVTGLVRVSYNATFLPGEDNFIGRCLKTLQYKVYNPPGLSYINLDDISAKIKDNPCIVTQDVYILHHVKPKDFHRLHYLESNC